MGQEHGGRSCSRVNVMNKSLLGSRLISFTLGEAGEDDDDDKFICLLFSFLVLGRTICVCDEVKVACNA